MKYFFGIFIFMWLVAQQAAAQGMSTSRAGNVELGISGMIDMDPAEKNYGNVKLKLGYLLVNQIEAGGTINFGTEPSGLRESITVFGEYICEPIIGVVPFIGGQFKYAKMPKESGDENTKIPGTYFGSMVVLKEGLAVSLQLSLELADEAVFGNLGKRRKSNADIEIGYRIFF